MMSINLKDITKKYSQKTVLESVNISFEEGRCIGILGENGCGKTTLLSILSGVLIPDSGEFWYGGSDLIKDTKLRQSVAGYIPQGTPLIEELTAYENLCMWYSKEQISNSVENGVIGMLGIKDFMDVPVKKMSGGMKKRLSIACGVHHDPKLLIMDEPTAALDMPCREKIYTYFKDYIKRGNSIIIATHEAREIELCDELYILKHGNCVRYEYDGNIVHLVGQLR